MFDQEVRSPIQTVTLPGLPEVQVALLREDLLHPHVSGNKWRKLKYNFINAKDKHYKKVITFGGAYSNHIAATAACCQLFGFESVGIIRGDELHAESNATLSFASECGMQLIFVDRAAYRNKDQIGFIDKYVEKPEEYYLLPEGGTNHLAIKGTQEILDERTGPYQVIAVPAGTGGTATGIISSSHHEQETLVFSSLKGDFLENEIQQQIQSVSKKDHQWKLISDYHFGGYGKWDHRLIQFMNEFNALNAIQLDPIYNGKMLFGLHDMIKNDYFEPKTGIIAVHTGGTQAIVGFNEKNGGILK